MNRFAAVQEWSRAHGIRWSGLALTLIIAVAAFLRFTALPAGIPFNLSVDEPEIMDRAVRMIKTGDFNPHFFDYPGLYIYLQALVASLRFIAGANSGLWTSLDHVSTTNFYLWGRGVTALLGTLTVFLVYRAGARWDSRVAVMAASLMAVMPLHVRESHYVLTDVPVTFFVMLTLLLTFRAYEDGRLIDFCLAGAGAGLAAATKYPGGLVLILPLLAVWMVPGARSARLVASLAGVVISSGVAFLTAAPYTLLDLPGFLNGYGHLASYYYTTKTLSEPAAVTYYKHLSRGLGWPATILVFGGLAIGAIEVIRPADRARWVLILTFPVLFFYFLSGQRLIFGRYLLPLVPFVCVIGAAACMWAVDFLQRFGVPDKLRAAAAVAVAAVAILPPGQQSLGFVRSTLRTGTVEQAYLWIVANVPKGSKMVIETQALRLPPETYAATNVPQLVLDFRAPASYEDYRKAGTQFIVASSQRYGDALDRPYELPEVYKAYMTLFAQSHELIRFSPTAEHPGPEIRVFAVR